MDTAGGIWNKSQHIIACRLQTPHTYSFFFFCPYHIILLLLFMNGSASFMHHILPAVTVDLQMTQMQSLTGVSEAV